MTQGEKIDKIYDIVIVDHDKTTNLHSTVYDKGGIRDTLADVVRTQAAAPEPPQQSYWKGLLRENARWVVAGLVAIAIFNPAGLSQIFDIAKHFTGRAGHELVSHNTVSGPVDTD